MRKLEIDWEAALAVRQNWLAPKPGDLLFDARDFHQKAKAASRRAVRARYSRAAVLLSVAAIEAISNDALFSIYELLVDAWPSGCIDLAPWVHFKKVSSRPVERLLIRGTAGKKVRYVLRHLRRLGVASDDFGILEERLKRAIQTRNRIAHMGYLLKPKKYAVVLNPGQIVHLAGVALEAAEDYIGAVSYTFEEVNLGIATAPPDYSHPDWWSDADWG